MHGKPITEKTSTGGHCKNYKNELITRIRGQLLTIPQC